MSGARITGWGIALPDKVVTNEDLSARLDTSDAWITERTGIKERRIGGTTSGLAIEAGRAALARAGVRPEDVDAVILATTTPEGIVPGTSAAVQEGLGIGGGAFDLNAACSGFVYGLVTAHGLIATGARRILLVGSETLSKITDWDDRTLAVLVGDGAGAVVLEATDGPSELLGWHLGADGSLRHLLYCEHGGYLAMNGKEIFRHAVRAVIESSLVALQRAGLTPDDVDLFVPHQANARIIVAAAERLGIAPERYVVTIDRYGNTSSASIPLALADALETGRLREGSTVLLSGFGGGMTWASAVLRWGA
ncbi:beta-ketoacyl-ACP synthase III [Aciditerrimonas ferrireducens]|uniref:beta-ketoacyl-ACP synthase III n=1 Tax=Aciditerrimonas ferrireducens TaxID=667306 RepID=UPI002004586B|nr:beta-ketoacyl-ACP synthase III [Aciditerrimonas ferrireducens]MCK4176250.1 ketoacyl-ACP synthase III [Aciditerrimonas ferrireducens]